MMIMEEEKHQNIAEMKNDKQGFYHLLSSLSY